MFFNDMVNWIDYGIINVVGSNGVVKWVLYLWVLVVVYKIINGKEKFFFYFVDSGGGIGVLISDLLIGLWKDLIGYGLVIKIILNCFNIIWFFDLVVFIDDDGSVYLFFGGGVLNG